MRVAIVYDCIHPHTVGGAERWLRRLAEDLAPEHEVTYITRREWRGADPPELGGARLVGVSPGGPLYTESGRRRIGPPLRFGAGVLRHFLRNRRSYDVVHCVSFPYFSLIALRLALAGARGPRVFVEWLEYWTADYWRSYLGRFGGLAGRAVQRLCVRLTPTALVFSRLNADRLHAAGVRGAVEHLPGLFIGPAGEPGEPAEPPRLLFAGRHIPEKRPAVVPEVLALVRREHPDLEAVVLGDGPERDRVLFRAGELGVEGALSAPGVVDAAELARALGEAACLLLPSVREGHGMVVVEAAAVGTPVVVCRHLDNAATELIEEGVNGAIAADPSAEALAAAVARVLAAGAELRESTAAWFERDAAGLSADASIARLRELYGAR